MKNQPKWWSDEHTSVWDRVKSAMKRDWEQTKADLSSKGTDLNQDASDTIAQAAGKQPIPPASTPNAEFDEDSHAYGVGARHQYKDDPDWSDRLEAKLKEEWADLKSGKTWDEVKGSVRRGWDRAKS